MLNHTEGIAPLAVEAQNGIADCVQQRAVDAGPDLIKKDDLGIDHHRAAKFKQFFLPARQIASQLIRDLGDLQELNHLISLGADCGFLVTDL